MRAAVTGGLGDNARRPRSALPSRPRDRAEAAPRMPPSRPQTMPGSRTTTARFAAQPSGTDRLGGQIAVADVLGQCAIDQISGRLRAWQVVGVGGILDRVVGRTWAPRFRCGEAPRRRSARRPARGCRPGVGQPLDQPRQAGGVAQRAGVSPHPAPQLGQRRAHAGPVGLGGVHGGRFVVEAGLDGAAGEHEALEQRVRCQPVGAVTPLRAHSPLAYRPRRLVALSRPVSIPPIR